METLTEKIKRKRRTKRKIPNQSYPNSKVVIP